MYKNMAEENLSFLLADTFTCSPEHIGPHSHAYSSLKCVACKTLSDTSPFMSGQVING